jgi:hypothetical protein
MIKNDELKANADRILYEFGLHHKLEEIGTAHLIGSYRMDMMAWNDLDIDIENQNMSLEMLYELTAFIIERFHPVWYEGKQEINDKGKKSCSLTLKQSSRVRCGMLICVFLTEILSGTQRHTATILLRIQAGCRKILLFKSRMI